MQRPVPPERTTIEDVLRHAPLAAGTVSTMFGLASAAGRPWIVDRRYLHHLGYAVALSATGASTGHAVWQRRHWGRSASSALVALALLARTRGGSPMHRLVAGISLVGAVVTSFGTD